MTDADLEKHTDILVSAISDIKNRVGQLTPDESSQKELCTELEDLLLIVDSQRRSIRLTRQSVKDRELRKEKELQEALTSLGQYRAKEQSQQATTTSTGLGSLGEDRSATKPIIIAPPSSFARKIGDDVLSFFARPSSSPSSPPGLYASPDSPLNSDAEATPKTEAEKLQILKESNEAMYTILTKLMDDNTRLIEDIDGMIREKKKLEGQIDVWALKYNILEAKFKADQDAEKK